MDREEHTAGVRCFAAPAGHAISCSVPLARLTPARENDIVTALLRTRDQIEQEAVSVESWAS